MAIRRARVERRRAQKAAFGLCPVWPPALDFFISYKGEHCVLARKLADALALSGRTVWLDQYCIPPRDQSEFQALYETGIRKANTAVMLTTSDYLQSPYCHHENSIIASTHDRDHVCEISIDPGHHPHISGSARPLSIGALPEEQQVCTALNHILRASTQMGDFYGIDVSPNPHPANIRRCEHNGLTLTFEQGGWTEFAFRPKFLELAGDYAGKPLLYQTRVGAITLLWSIGLDPGSTPVRCKGEGRLELRQYMIRFLCKYSPDVFGIHPYVLPSHPEYWQISLAYHTGRGFGRRFPIYVPDPRNQNRNLELLFNFYYAGSFDNYLRVIPSIDRLVGSIRVS